MTTLSAILLFVAMLGLWKAEADGLIGQPLSTVLWLGTVAAFLLVSKWALEEMRNPREEDRRNDRERPLTSH